MEILLENKYENAAREEGDHVMISNSELADSPESCGWVIPEITVPYKVQEPHLMGKKLCQESDEWLASYGVDKQLGPELWKSLLKGKVTHIMTHVVPSVSDKDFLFQCKLMLVLFAFDAIMDESPVGKYEEESLDLVLEIVTVLMWKYPEEPSLLECLTPLYNLTSSDTSKHSMETFRSHLLEAKHREECNLDFSPIGTAWKDFWAEFLGYGLPDEHNVTLAQSLLEWIVSCLEEVHYRISGSVPGLEDYIALRRKTVGLKPSVLSLGGMIHQCTPAGIPNSLLNSPPMQQLLLATTDVVAWDNDVFSIDKESVSSEKFRKNLEMLGLHCRSIYVLPDECIVNKEKLNLVDIISHEQKCSYKEAAEEFVAKMVSDRTDDMESAIPDLTAAASADLQPALQMYATGCRNWISGSHEWSRNSPRYNQSQNF